MMVFVGSFIGGNYITRTETWRTELVNLRDTQLHWHLISPTERYRMKTSPHQRMSLHITSVSTFVFELLYTQSYGK